MYLSFHMEWNKTMYNVCTKPTGVLCLMSLVFRYEIIGVGDMILGINLNYYLQLKRIVSYSYVMNNHFHICC